MTATAQATAAICIISVIGLLAMVTIELRQGLRDDARWEGSMLTLLIVAVVTGLYTIASVLVRVV